MVLTAKKIEKNEGGKVVLSYIVIQGTLTDFYDWDYDPGLINSWGAIVQTGHGTLGDGGWVFRSQVNFNTEFPLPTPSYLINLVP